MAAPIIKGGNRPHLKGMMWGIPAPGQIGAMGAPALVTHVRNLESPFWIGSLRNAALRCLIPATALRIGNPQTGKWLSVAESRTFTLAGIWRDDGEVTMFAMLLTSPGPALSRIHPGGVPVIIGSENRADWMTDDWKRAQKLVQPYPAQNLVIGDTIPVV